MKRAAWALLALALGCAPSPPPLAPRERAWLAAPEEIPGEFLWRQRIRFVRGSRVQELDVALQKRCGELTLALLVPLAPAPVVLVQRGRDLDVSGPAAARGAAPAQRLLLDLHRAFFLELAPRAGASGAREVVSGGQRFADEWSDGRLQRRRVSAGEPLETIIISYPGGWDPSEGPPRAVIENRRFGYRLEIQTVSRETLAERCETQ